MLQRVPNNSALKSDAYAWFKQLSVIGWLVATGYGALEYEVRKKKAKELKKYIAGTCEAGLHRLLKNTRDRHS